MTLLQLEELIDGCKNGNNGGLQWNYESALLDKLQQMVPIMPKERELSKLEIINYVIDYIRQLKELIVEDEKL